MKAKKSESVSIENFIFYIIFILRDEKTEYNMKIIHFQMKDKEDDESGEEDENEKDISLPKGCVIHFVDVPEKCTREDIKERLGELDANIAFVDFKIGDKEGWVRLQEENTAKTIIDKMTDNQVSVFVIL